MCMDDHLMFVCRVTMNFFFLCSVCCFVCIVWGKGAIDLEIVCKQLKKRTASEIKSKC